MWRLGAREADFSAEDCAETNLLPRVPQLMTWASAEHLAPVFPAVRAKADSCQGTQKRGEARGPAAWEGAS